MAGKALLPWPQNPTCNMPKRKKPNSYLLIPKQKLIMPTTQKKPLKKSPLSKKHLPNLHIANPTKEVEIKKLLVQINDLKLEVVSLSNELAFKNEAHHDDVSDYNNQIYSLNKSVKKLQDRNIYIESRCNEFTEQTRQLLKLKNSLSLNDEFKIDFIIANFEKMTLGTLEKSLA